MTNNQTARQLQSIECSRLVQEKKSIESKIQDFESILRSQNVGMRTALVDAEGYPRGDIDIYAIKHARAALAPLYNDLEFKSIEIEQSLIALHSLPVDPAENPPVLELKPFAKVNGVAPDSPAGISGLKRGDLVLMFGDIDCFHPNPLETMASLLPHLEFKSVKLKIQRDTKKLTLVLVPKPWEGNDKEQNNVNTAAPVSSWSVWDSLKEAGQIVARDLSDMGNLKFNETQDENGGNVGALESVLDSLDDSLEKAEKIAIKGISDFGSGLAAGLSNLFVQKPDIMPFNNSLSDRATKEIFDAGLDPNTFIDPMESLDTLLIERFEKFRESFDQIAYAGRIARRFDEQPQMIQFMKSIVPEKLSEEDFWLRYYFRVSELIFAQEQRLLLLQSGIQEPVDEEVAWSSDDNEGEMTPKMGSEKNNESDAVPDKIVAVDSVDPATGSCASINSDDLLENANSKASEAKVDDENTEKFLKMEPALNDPTSLVDKFGTDNSENIPITHPESVSSGGFEIVEKKDEDWGGWD